MNNADTPAMPSCSRPDAFHGLTKREHFAAMAMQGILSNPNTGGHIEDILKELPDCCVKISDALLAELERTNA